MVHRSDHVHGFVAEPTHHYRALQRRYDYARGLSGIRTGTYLPVPDALLDDAADEPEPARHRLLSSLLERRVGVVGLDSGIEDGAAARNRRVSDEAAEHVDYREETVQRPVMAYQRRFEARSHKGRGIVERL